MSEYEEDQEFVREMISDPETGGPVTFLRHVETTPNPARSWRRVPATDLQFTATAVTTKTLKTQESQGYTAGAEDSKDSLPGFAQILLPPAPDGSPYAFEPAVRDLVTVRGERYTVLEVERIEPGGVLLLYKIKVRK